MTIIKVIGPPIEPIYIARTHWESWILDTTNKTITFNQDEQSCQWSQDLYESNTFSNTFKLNEITIFHCSIGECHLNIGFWINESFVNTYDLERFSDLSSKSFDEEKFWHYVNAERPFKYDSRIGSDSGKKKELSFKYSKPFHFKAKNFFDFIRPYVRDDVWTKLDAGAFLYPLSPWEILLKALDPNRAPFSEKDRGAWRKQLEESNILLNNGAINPEWIASTQLPTSVLELVIENEKELGFDTSQYSLESSADIQNDDIVTKLQELAELKEKGLIDEEEFKSAKNKLLE